MFLYTTKFFNLAEQTKEEFDYTDLLDALTVAKRIHLDGIQAMSNDEFAEKITVLLTVGIIHVGRKTDAYPDGEYMLQLTKREGNGRETVINSNATTANPLSFIPSQLGAPVAKANNLERIPPVAESNMSHEWDAQFIKGDQNPETD